MCDHICIPTYDSPYMIVICDCLGDLFDRSLQAELKRQPQLLTLKPKDVDVDPPQVLFRARLKGYYVCDKLCRVWVLQTLRDARKRGEFFVKWTDSASGAVHDGTKIFAHFFTINYLSLHKPGMSVIFDEAGALRSTSCHVHKIRNYVWAYRFLLARRCHDMAKQMYSNRKYAPAAWQPLRDWLYRNPVVTTSRMSRLNSFNKTDDDLHVVVAKCLWKLCNGANLPWGRASLQPSAYSDISLTEKVETTEYACG